MSPKVYNAFYLLVIMSFFFAGPLKADETLDEVRQHASRLTCAELLTEKIESEAFFLKRFAEGVTAALMDHQGLPRAQVLALQGFPVGVWPRLVRPDVLREYGRQEFEDQMEIIPLDARENFAFELAARSALRAEIFRWPDEAPTEKRARRCIKSEKTPVEYRNLILSQLVLHWELGLPYTPMFDYFLRNLLTHYLGETWAVYDSP